MRTAFFSPSTGRHQWCSRQRPEVPEVPVTCRTGVCLEGPRRRRRNHVRLDVLGVKDTVIENEDGRIDDIPG